MVILFDRRCFKCNKIINRQGKSGLCRVCCDKFNSRGGWHWSDESRKKLSKTIRDQLSKGIRKTIKGKKLNLTLAQRKYRSEHMKRINKRAKIKKMRERGLMGAKGKRWKLNLSQEKRNKISLRMIKNWRNGVYKYSNIGRCKSGYREDIGHFVRSSWEADVARLLQVQEIRYEYEKYTFKTPFGSYRPDFYIFDENYFIEVKGYDSSIALNKRNYVRNQYGKKIIVVGSKRFKRLMLEFTDVDLRPYFLENVFYSGNFWD